jgi:hypothetical protein
MFARFLAVVFVGATVAGLAALADGLAPPRETPEPPVAAAVCLCGGDCAPDCPCGCQRSE